MMSNSVVDATPINLKERIAALQQRTLTPVQQSPIQNVKTSPPIPTTANLRDKIAKFERKGGVPIPRGSFSLGAAPNVDVVAAKQKGELYGNRIPSAGQAGQSVHGRSFSLSPGPGGFERKRFSSASFELSSTVSSPLEASNSLQEHFRSVSASLPNDVEDGASPQSLSEQIDHNVSNSPTSHAEPKFDKLSKEDVRDSDGIEKISSPVIIMSPSANNDTSMDGEAIRTDASVLESSVISIPTKTEDLSSDCVIDRAIFSSKDETLLLTAGQAGQQSMKKDGFQTAGQSLVTRIPISRQTSSISVRIQEPSISTCTKDDDLLKTRPLERIDNKFTSPSGSTNATSNVPESATSGVSLDGPVDRSSRIPRVRAPPSSKSEGPVFIPSSERRDTRNPTKPELPTNDLTSSSLLVPGILTRQTSASSVRSYNAQTSKETSVQIVTNNAGVRGRTMYSNETPISRVPVRIQTTSFLDSEPALDLSLLVAQAAQLEEHLSTGEGTTTQSRSKQSQLKAVASKSFDDLGRTERRVENSIPANSTTQYTVRSVVSAPGKRSNLPIPTSSTSSLSWRNTFHVSSLGRGRRAKTVDSMRSRRYLSDKSSDDSGPVLTPPSPTFELVTPPLLDAESNSSSSSLWSSPKRSAKRALSRSSMFMNRMFSRAGRSSTSLALPDDTSIYSNRSHSPMSSLTPLSLTPIIHSAHSPSLSPRLSMLSEDAPSIFSPTFEKEIFEKISSITNSP